MNHKQALEIIRLNNRLYFDGKAEIVDQKKTILIDLPKDNENYKTILAMNSLSIFFKVESTVDSFGEMLKIHLK